MPNRDIKESCRTSLSLATLSHGAERLFWRLTTYADDFGRMPADAGVLRGQCFSAMLDTVREKDVSGWLAELEAADLVRTYKTEDGKTFAFFPTWARHQRIRAKHSKYPSPTSAGICRQTTANAPEVPKYPSSAVDTEVPPKNPSVGLRPTAIAILDFLNRKTGKQYQPVEANLGMIMARLKGGATADQLRAVVGRKTAEWGADEKMAKFLRPATLFNATKFAQYQGELPATAFDNGQPA